MVDPTVQDLFGLDRDVARAVAALDRAGETPFEGLRHVATRSTWQALRELSPSAADVPLRDALMRWVEWLVDARVGLPDDEARARAEAAPVGRFEGDPPQRVSWRQAWRGLASARTPEETKLWLDAAADAAEPLASALRTRAARRIEIARRMGRAHPWEPQLDIGATALGAAATKLLDATEDVARAVSREGVSRGAVGRQTHPAAILAHAFARDAGEGWPARLSPAWFEEVLGPGPRNWPIRMGALPSPVGAASFARALYAFGFAARVAAAPSSLPFSLAREPAFVSAHRLGFVLGSLPADPQFQLKSLRLGRRQALAQSRVLTRAALLEARLHAARILLGDDAALAPVDRFAEISVRLFGAPLDPRLRGAWPAARVDEPARLVALLQAQAMQDGLRNRFDSDWFRNPRAWSFLREEGGAAARETPRADALEPAAALLARAFEEALG